MLGSLILQAVYFAQNPGLDLPLLAFWLVGNILPDVLAALLGVLVIWLDSRKLRKRNTTEKTGQERREQFVERISRLISSITLVIFVSHLIVPVVLFPVHASCNGSSLSTDEFIETFDPDCDYTGAPKGIVEQPKNRNYKEGLNDIEGVPPEVAQELYELCVVQGQCNFDEAIGAYQEGDTGIVDALRQGVDGFAEDLGGIMVRDAGRGADFLSDFRNDPWGTGIGVVKDFIGFTSGAYMREGGAMFLMGQLNAAGTYVGALRRDFKGTVSRTLKPFGAIGNGIRNYFVDSHEYATRNPRKIGSGIFGQLGTVFNSATYSFNKRYPGGIQGAKKYLTRALADRNTYWNLLKAPLSPTTVRLFEQGHYLKATGRARGEILVQGAEAMAGQWAVGKVLPKVPGVATLVGRASAKSTGFDKEAFLKGAQVYDRNGLTIAGRSLQKKMNRPGSVYPTVPQKSLELNTHAQRMADEILNDPHVTMNKHVVTENGKDLTVIDIIDSKGRAIRYDENNIMIGFREPPKK